MNFGGIFAKKKTPDEILRENKRQLDRAIRELERENFKMKDQEIKLKNDIKRAAKDNQMETVKILARSVVRNRSASNKLMALKAQLQAISMRLQTLKSTQSMTNAMRGATKAMTVMNQRMNVPTLQKIVMEFEKQNAKTEMTEDLMGDAVDNALGADNEEEESDNLVKQVLDEIGIGTTEQLATAPTKQQQVAEEEPAADLDKEIMDRLNKLRNQ